MLYSFLHSLGFISWGLLKRFWNGNVFFKANHSAQREQISKFLSFCYNMVFNSIWIWTFDTQDDIHMTWELFFCFKLCIYVRKILPMQRNIENFFLLMWGASLQKGLNTFWIESESVQSAWCVMVRTIQHREDCTLSLSIQNGVRPFCRLTPQLSSHSHTYIL